MNHGEPAQFQCRECQVIFTPVVDGIRNTEYVEKSEKQPVDYGRPICCPFCGDADMKSLGSGENMSILV